MTGQTTIPISGAPTTTWRDAALVPTLVGVASMLAVISSLGVPLIPTISRADHVSVSTGQWLLTGTLLAGALATPVMGRLADGPRQRQVVLAALSSVLIGCVLSAEWNVFTVVVLGRALQGVGLGLLPVTMAIARRQLSKERAGRTIAALSVTTAVGAGLGYPVTGLIAEVFDFHFAFWFGAIMAAAGLCLAATVLPKRSEGPSRHFDTLGVLLLGLAVTGVSVVLSEAGEWGWTSARSLVILAVAAALVALWIPYELRLTDPLVNLRQVRNRSVLTADVSGFMICLAMYLFLPVVVELVQAPPSIGYGFGASILVSGLVLIPLSVTTFAASRCLAVYERRFGTRSMIPLGTVVLALSTLFFAFAHQSLWEAFVATGISGIGFGFTFGAMPGFIIRAVPPHETGSATGFYQVVRSVGLSLGSALAASILAVYTRAHHTYPAEWGYQVGLLVAAALCLTSALLSYILPGRSRASAPAPSNKDLEEFLIEEAELGGAGIMLAEENWPPEDPAAPS